MRAAASSALGDVVVNSGTNLINNWFAVFSGSLKVGTCFLNNEIHVILINFIVYLKLLNYK